MFHSSMDISLKPERTTLLLNNMKIKLALKECGDLRSAGILC